MAKGDREKGPEITLSQLSTDDMREEQRIEMSKHMIMGMKIDRAVEFLSQMDPVENIEKTLQKTEVEIREGKAQMNTMVQNWLAMWDKAFSEAEDVPADLIGRAADLAKSSREKE